MNAKPQLPIRNFYYMLAYAWQRTPPAKLNVVGAEDSPDAVHLFAKLLASGIRELARRAIDRGYVTTTDLLRSPRGKMLVEASLKRQTVRRGAIVCEFDELTANVLHNQLIKSVAMALAKTTGLERDLRTDLMRQCTVLHGVDEIAVRAVQFHRLTLSRNQSNYRPLLRLCEIIHRQLLPVKGGAEYRFNDIVEDELVMSQLFEEFLLSFYQLEQQRFTVAAESRQWLGHALDPRDWALMPGMRTDLTFRSADFTLVFDAKYYKEPLVTYMGRRQIRAGHLYQLAAYLQREAGAHSTKQTGGALVYGLVADSFSHAYVLNGVPVRIEGVDLRRPWSEIHDRLRGIVTEFEPWAAAGFTDTEFRCFSGIGGGPWDEGQRDDGLSAGSSSLRL